MPGSDGGPQQSLPMSPHGCKTAFFRLQASARFAEAGRLSWKTNFLLPADTSSGCVSPEYGFPAETCPAYFRANRPSQVKYYIF
jgi:hypothetical protein